LKGNQTRHQGAEPGNCARFRNFALKMCSVFVIFESAFSNMTQLKSYTNRMADGTCMPACAWRLRKLKRTLTLSPKTRNKELICYFVGVLLSFF